MPAFRPEDTGELAARLMAAAFVAPHELTQELPERVGRYELLKPLGSGASGEVFLAWDPSLRREVALKVLSVGLTDARFQREMKVLASLSHPDVVQVFDGGVHAGRPFFVMEVVHGQPLDLRSLEHGEAARVLSRVALACHGVHEQGILHRDLKPANVLLGENGRLAVADFGVAKLLEPGDEKRLTQVGALVGTPAYMAPEQLTSEPLDARTDVYGLGVMLYEALARQLPFEAVSTTDLALKVCSTAPTPPSQLRADVPPALEAIALRAMAREPKQRYASAQELAAALQRWLRQPGAELATGDGPPRPLLAGAAVGAVALVACVLALALGGGGREDPPLPAPHSQPEPQPEAIPEPEPTAEGSSRVSERSAATPAGSESPRPSPAADRAVLLIELLAEVEAWMNEEAPERWRDPAYARLSQILGRTDELLGEGGAELSDSERQLGLLVRGRALRGLGRSEEAAVELERGQALAGPRRGDCFSARLRALRDLSCSDWSVLQPANRQQKQRLLAAGDPAALGLTATRLTLARTTLQVIGGKSPEAALAELEGLEVPPTDRPDWRISRVYLLLRLKRHQPVWDELSEAARPRRTRLAAFGAAVVMRLRVRQGTPLAAFEKQLAQAATGMVDPLGGHPTGRDQRRLACTATRFLLLSVAQLDALPASPASERTQVLRGLLDVLAAEPVPDPLARTTHASLLLLSALLDGELTPEARCARIEQALTLLPAPAVSEASGAGPFAEQQLLVSAAHMACARLRVRAGRSAESDLRSAQEAITRARRVVPDDNTELPTQQAVHDLLLKETR